MSVISVVEAGRAKFRGKKYLRWGVDDLYPQRCIDFVDSCPTLEMAVDTRAFFIAGKGCEDETAGSQIVNFRRMTLNDCINQSARDSQEISVVAIHVRYNALLQPCEITPVPVERFRLGNPDDRGFINQVYIVKKMDSFNSFLRKSSKEIPYYAFNPKPEVVLQQIKDSGGIAKYKGQIAYCFIGNKPGARTYPKVWFHSALDPIETIISNNKSLKRDTKRGFAVRTKITKYGYHSEPTPEQKEAVEEDLKEFIGDDGSQIYVEYAANQESKSDIDAFETADLSKTYAYSKNSSKEDIWDLARIPRNLYGQLIAGKLGNREELEQGINYVSQCVVDKIQRQIEQLYTDVLQNFSKPILSGPMKIRNLTIDDFMPKKTEENPVVPPVNTPEDGANNQ